MTVRMDNTSSMSDRSININSSLALFYRDIGEYPVIYPITTYYLMPIIQCSRVVHLLWYCVGFVGNSVSLKIWTIPRMSRLNTSALYLVAIAACDIVYQVLHVFIYLRYFWGIASMDKPVLCEIWNILYMIPQYGSQLLVFGFTVERFVSICKPFQSDRFSKSHRIPKEIAIIIAISCLFALPQGYYWRVDERGFCEIPNKPELMKSYGIWSVVTETIIFFFVPISTLSLNIFVIYYTKKALRKRSCGSTMDDNSCESRIHRTHRQKDSRYRPATVTLLCISFFRILTQLPVSIAYTMQTMDEFDFGNVMPLSQMQDDPQWRAFFKYWGARILIETIGASHHALSFFIFYISTKQFRWELKQLITTIKQNASSRYIVELKFNFTNSPSQQTEVRRAPTKAFQSSKTKT